MRRASCLILATLLGAVPHGSVVAQSDMHWALRPVVRPELPLVADAAWARNGIDRFVLARLERDGLRPSARADRQTLARRLSLVMHGLPPAPEAIDAFERDRRPDALERRIDAALSSPRYGERWGRHWLDVARFAETNGFETNTPRPNAWHYRDWVIDAFNTDMPWNRFVTAQLAGDGTADDAATGFLVAGPYDTVKSPAPLFAENQRQDELADMINATSTAFLGMTVACARCHDHKFDPIPQRDYFAMGAMLSGVRHGERPLRTSNDDRLDEERRDEEALQGRLEAQLRELPQGSLRSRIESKHNIDRFDPIRASAIRFTIAKTNGSAVEPCIDELEVWTASSDTGSSNVALAANGGRATSSGDYAGNPKHRLPHVNDGHYGNGRSWISNQHGAGWVRIDFAAPATIQRVEWGRDRTGRYGDRTPIEYVIEALGNGGWVRVSDQTDRLLQGVPVTATPAGPGHADRVSGERARALLRRYEDVRGSIARRAPRPSAYTGSLEQPSPTHLLHRGDPGHPAEVVAPDVPSVFPTTGLAIDAPERERRLALARAINAPTNPLTARVIVNRVWMHHFGEGLVDTPNDFGRMGSLPTHPELLDWLASEFIDSGYSIKQLQRLIIGSATWQQRSHGRPAARTVDAGSRLLWRFPPRRLEAEAIRDATLFVSGELSFVTSGPGFELFEPNTNYVRVYIPRERFEADGLRRMVYARVVRMEKDATFGAFDAPDAGQLCARRNRSTTALQSLNMLNAPFMLRRAAAFAARIESATPGIDERVRHAFRVALGRTPDRVEQRSGTQLVKSHGLEALCRALLNSNEFLYIP